MARRSHVHSRAKTGRGHGYMRSIRCEIFLCLGGVGLGELRRGRLRAERAAHRDKARGRTREEGRRGSGKGHPALRKRLRRRRHERSSVLANAVRWLLSVLRSPPFPESSQVQRFEARRGRLSRSVLIVMSVAWSIEETVRPEGRPRRRRSTASVIILHAGLRPLRNERRPRAHRRGPESRALRDLAPASAA